jgi:prolyl-tRNA synthetase
MRKLTKALKGILPRSEEIAFLDVDSAWSEIVTKEIDSYRQLPRSLVWRKADRIEFAALAATDAQFIKIYHQWVQDLHDSFSTLGIVVPAQAKTQWVHVDPQGRDALLACNRCDYAAPAAWAEFKREPGIDPSEAELIRVETPGATTIQSLTEFLKIDARQTLKSMFFSAANGTIVLAIIRGDLDLSMPKLEAAASQGALKPTDSEQLSRIGSLPGFGGPINLNTGKLKFISVADLSIEMGSGFVVGANREDMHLQGVSYPRDFEVTRVLDLALGSAGNNCQHCEGVLEEVQGYSLARWENHVGWFSFTASGGKNKTGIVGLGRINLLELLKAVMQIHTDDKGFAWPAILSPYDVHLLSIRADEVAGQLADDLSRKGLSILLDDRDQSPGVKFADADLIGCPLRVIMSQRAIDSDQFEITFRRTGQTAIQSGPALPDYIESSFAKLM